MLGSNSKSVANIVETAASSSNMFTTCSQNASKTCECEISRFNVLAGERFHFQSAANTTEMFGFVSKLLQGP